MTVLAAGDTMPDFVYQTAFEKGLHLADTVKRVEGKTALVFLRYLGCTLCQYSLHQYLVGYDKITATGGQALIVFQSTPEVIAADLEDRALPFDIICDPSQELYHAFEIGAVADKHDLLDKDGIAFLKQIKADGFKHGVYEGNELQLPATFVVDRNLTVTYAHYGVRGNDVPAPDELATVME